MFLFVIFEYSEAQTLRIIEGGRKSSIRAVSVADPSVIWISGSGGWFAKSINGGKSWSWNQLDKYKLSDFRGIKAFSADRAVLMSSGSPGLILMTEDGGKSWTESYRNESADIFLDGISFYNDKEGLVYGDPLKGEMQLLKSVDGGKSWKDISSNMKIKLMAGEASFAASNTGLYTMGAGKTWILTGGRQSRIFYSPDKGEGWEVFDCPVIQGAETQGPFSIAFYDGKTGAVAGGDYKADTVGTRSFFLTNDGGRTWKEPARGPGGFRSCVVYLSAEILVATGTSGTDISRDGGQHWTPLSKQGYHVVSVLEKGKTAVLAGSDGRLALLNL